MPDQTDPTRALIRRAYADLSYHGETGTETDLADVVRRAGRPRAHEGTADVIALEPRRTRRRFAAVATFAAAVVTILGVYAASAGLQPQQVTGHASPTVLPSGKATMTATATATAATTATAEPNGTPTPDGSVPPPGTTPPVSVPPPAPGVLPSSCAVSWVMELAGTTFNVTRARGSCPALPLDRLWLLDAAGGNGRVGPGDAVLWPVVPVDGGKGPVRPPFTFRPGAWPGPVQGHYYEIIYVTERAAAQLRPGQDAATAYEDAHTISLHVIA